MNWGESPECENKAEQIEWNPEQSDHAGLKPEKQSGGCDELQTEGDQGELWMRKRLQSDVDRMINFSTFSTLK